MKWAYFNPQHGCRYSLLRSKNWKFQAGSKSGCRKYGIPVRIVDTNVRDKLQDHIIKGTSFELADGFRHNQHFGKNIEYKFKKLDTESCCKSIVFICTNHSTYSSFFRNLAAAGFVLATSFKASSLSAIAFTTKGLAINLWCQANQSGYSFSQSTSPFSNT